MEQDLVRITNRMTEIREDLDEIKKIKESVRTETEIRATFTIWLDGEPKNFATKGNKRSVYDLLDIKEKQLLEDYRELHSKIIKFN